MKKKILTAYLCLCLISVVAGVPFLLHFYWLDGIEYNRVITMTQGVDSLNLQLEKTEYQKGEMVYGYTSFCNNRDVYGQISWNLLNEMVVTFAPNPLKRLPIGCYPETQDHLLKFEIKEIPKNASKGEHYFTGISCYTLPGDRQRCMEWKTQKFNVI